MRNCVFDGCARRHDSHCWGTPLYSTSLGSEDLGHRSVRLQQIYGFKDPTKVTAFLRTADATLLEHALAVMKERACGLSLQNLSQNLKERCFGQLTLKVQGPTTLNPGDSFVCRVCAFHGKRWCRIGEGIIFDIHSCGVSTIWLKPTLHIIFTGMVDPSCTVLKHFVLAKENGLQFNAYQCSAAMTSYKNASMRLWSLTIICITVILTVW